MKTKLLLDNETLARLFQALALLLHAGLPMNDSLFLLADDETGREKELLQSMGREMDGGATLSMAMANSSAFPYHASAMVTVGEETGRVEEALKALSEYYDQQDAINREVKSALTYPVILLILMLAIVGVLLIKVLPVFDDVYASLGGSLTGLAGGLLRLGGALEAAMPALLVLLAVIALFALAFALLPSFRTAVQNAYRARRGNKGIGAKLANARFAQALSMALHSGLTLEEGVTLAGELLADIPQAADEARRCAEQLAQGGALADVLKSAALLSPKDSRMLTVGMKSGKGEEVMSDIAHRSSEEATAAIRHLVGRIEPALVLTASAIVGVILLSVMLPLMNIMTAIG